MSWIVKAGKQGKKIVKKLIMPAEKHYVGYTRRIERVQTTRRICAMTFDDGPMGLPASPDRFDGRTLTDVLLDTLAQYGARGSFDVIGDTSANYPDEAGKLAAPRGAACASTIIRTSIVTSRAARSTMTASSAVCSPRATRSRTTATGTSFSARNRLYTARANTFPALMPRWRISAACTRSCRRAMAIR